MTRSADARDRAGVALGRGVDDDHLLLIALVRPVGPAKVYVYRMVGIMALALGIVLAFSATAMWQWSAQP